MLSYMKRLFIAGLGVLTAMAACGGNVVVDPAGGSGGAGGASVSSTGPGTTTGSTTGPGPGTSSVSSSSGFTTSTGPAGCLTCSESIDQGQLDPGALCGFNGPPSSVDIWFGLAKCICELICSQCQDNWCTDFQSATAECVMCLNDTSTILSNCPSEASACLNDTP